MLHFDCDYMEGAHPLIMKRLMETNFEQTPGYGQDKYSDNAKALICGQLGNQSAEVHFISGGTQTNATVIGALLRGPEAVIAASSGHINVHEAGAIEATGHKVIALGSREGKLTASEIEEYMRDFYADETWMHMSIPAMVYLSFPTEFGTLYTLDELQAISNVCKRYSLKLYLDGARLGYALAARQNDVTLKDLARLCDAFYIGGTKVGALFGEVVVLKNKDVAPHFFTYVKRNGALLAKGRLLGIQFEVLFTDGLYLECGRNGVERALEIKAAFEAGGYKTVHDSPTNQQFFCLPNNLIDRLLEKATFEYWGPRGAEYSTVRFVAGWATTADDVRQLASLIVQPSCKLK